MSHEIGEPEEDKISDDLLPYRISSGYLIYLCEEILPELYVEQPQGSVYDGEAPDHSSAIRIFWARNPEEVLDEREERLVEWVVKAG